MPPPSVVLSFWRVYRTSTNLRLIRYLVRYIPATCTIQYPVLVRIVQVVLHTTGVISKFKISKYYVQYHTIFRDDAQFQFINQYHQVQEGMTFPLCEANKPLKRPGQYYLCTSSTYHHDEDCIFTG